MSVVAIAAQNHPASVAPLYGSLRERVTKDASWKIYGACGTIPAEQCERCKKFSEGMVRCKCKHPEFAPTTPQAWSDFWYPDRGSDFTSPKKICNKACPVRKACLEYALANHEVFGIWGGHTERERRRLRMGRSLWVVCVYCNGSVKAGQWTRKTCNRQQCKDRWSDERTGIWRPTVVSSCECCDFRVVADTAQRVCNKQACKDWLSKHPEEPVSSEEPEHNYVILAQGVFDLADVVLDGIPRPVRRARTAHPSESQLVIEELAA